jgi:uncharacterized membrane protein
MRKILAAIIALIMLSFLLGLYLYPEMPEQMASHWDAQGRVNGYMDRFWGLFLMPIMSAGLFLLFIFIPLIDPLKENIDKFRNQYERFILLIMMFFLYIYLLTLIWNLGMRFDMVQMLIPAMALLFFYAGILISNAKRNWFIGIRTPWTLSSDVVWDKTHLIGGKLFKIAALLVLLGLIFPKQAFLLLLAPIILASIYAVVYSYVVYKQENKKGRAKRIGKRKNNQSQHSRD